MAFEPIALGGLLPATIRVTAGDIRRGAVRNCLRCPVANALRRHFRAAMVSVSPTAGAWVDLSRSVNGFWCVSLDLPEEVAAEITCTALACSRQALCKDSAIAPRKPREGPKTYQTGENIPVLAPFFDKPRSWRLGVCKCRPFGHVRGVSP